MGLGARRGAGATRAVPLLLERGKGCVAWSGFAPRAVDGVILGTCVIRQDSNCESSRSHDALRCLVHETKGHVALEWVTQERETSEGRGAIVQGCMLGARTETACWSSPPMADGEPPLHPYHGAPDRAASAPFP